MLRSDIWLDVLRALTFPFLFLGGVILRLLQWLASPFLYLAWVLGITLSQPVRFLAKFEVTLRISLLDSVSLLNQPQTILVFLSVAVLTGVLSAVILYRVSRVLSQSFEIRLPKTRLSKGHTAASYRASRRTKQGNRKLEMYETQNKPLPEPASSALAQSAMKSPLLRGKKPRWQYELYSSTILEEDDDSDFDPAS